MSINGLVTIEGVKKTVFGAGAISQLGHECKALKTSRALVVIDRELISRGSLY